MSMGLVYEWVHFIVHTRVVPRSQLGKDLKRHHTLHHLKDETCWLAFTAPPIDTLFGTVPSSSPSPSSSSSSHSPDQQQQQQQQRRRGASSATTGGADAATAVAGREDDEATTTFFFFGGPLMMTRGWLLGIRKARAAPLTRGGDMCRVISMYACRFNICRVKASAAMLDVCVTACYRLRFPRSTATWRFVSGLVGWGAPWKDTSGVATRYTSEENFAQRWRADTGAF
ncbi:unnamed protein product [Ectocarpus fasciculatus]